MVLYIYANTAVEKYAQCARKFAESMLAQGVRCFTDSANSAVFAGTEIEYCERTKIRDNCSLVAAIGGDGTILHAAQYALAADIPIFGVNAGRVGYLAAFDSEKQKNIAPADIEALECLPRLVLELYIEGAGSCYAVNDVVVSKTDIARTVELDVKTERLHIATLRADAVIVATPTGSTAYSLSAGGPVLAPDTDAMVVTPVCSHSLFSRSMVLPAQRTVIISPTQRDENGVIVCVDGKTVAANSNANVTVTRSERVMRLLTRPLEERKAIYFGN